MNNMEGIYNLNTNSSLATMHVRLKWVKLSQVMRLIHELDRQLLSNDLLELITRDPNFCLQQVIPH
jgi:hypothetical protein